MKGGSLVVNAGSSSLKLSVFDRDLSETHRGAVSEIGGAARMKLDGASTPVDAPDHEAALGALLGALTAEGVRLGDLSVAGHRVVHGGTKLIRPVRITPEVEREIEACGTLAPLHNPVNLLGIRALAKAAPALPQTASFDTAFHATIPDVATRYAVPDSVHADGIRRFGFHGTSYAALTSALPGISGAPLPPRLLAFHLGNGASICAVRDGKSIATTMGYSPVSGLTMGTRVGDIDANAVLRLVAERGETATHRLLNHDSGLRGLSGGVSDMAELEARNDAAADFAIRHFSYWALRHAGSFIAAMEGLDAIAFTGGIGEHSARIRSDILKGLAWLGVILDEEANARNATRLATETSPISAWIVPAEEERQIAREALDLIA